MKKYLKILKNCLLFAGVEEENILSMLSCLGAAVQSYQKDTFVFIEGDAVSCVGILIAGKAQITTEDAMGNRSIVANITPGELFAEAIVCAGIRYSPVTVMAVEDTKVLWIDVQKIITTCGNACGFHVKLIENLLRVIAEKNMALNRKLNFMSMRTTRDKLMEYLLSQYKRKKENPFTIPFNRNELADYLCVDRSAMSRELGKMRDEGLIVFSKNLFTLKGILG